MTPRSEEIELIFDNNLWDFFYFIIFLNIYAENVCDFLWVVSPTTI